MRAQGSAAHVAVVGGGVLGVSVAAHLARRGARVTLVTQGALADGASGRSLSWLNSYGRRSDAYHRLRLMGLDRYRALAADPGTSQWLRFDGALTWTAPGEAGGSRADLEHMLRAGYPAQWLTPHEVRDRVPGVDPDAVPEEGAVLTPAEGWVDLTRLVAHLAGRLTADGGTVMTDAGPCRIEVRGDRVTAVRTGSGGLIGVDAAVLATGAAVPDAVAALGVGIPAATSTGLVVRTPSLASPLRAVLNTPSVSLRPAPGGGLVMDAGWSEEQVVRGEDGTYRVEDSTVQGLLRAASAVLAGHPDLSAESYGAGAKPIPGDGEPVVGALPGVTGYCVAFTHSGATLGLVLGELLADEILSGHPAVVLDAFRPGRFG